MKEEELIKKLESINFPKIEDESHRRRLRMALLQSQYFQEQPGRFAALKSKLREGIDTMKGLISWRPRWKPALVGTLAIALIIGCALIIPPHFGQSPEVLAAEIVKNSPEVKAVLDEGEIRIMDLFVVGDNREAVVLCGTATRPPAVAKVDLKGKKVTAVVGVSVPKLSETEREEAISIANADPKVKELLDKGATISEVYPAILSSIARFKFTSVSSSGTSEGYGLDVTGSKMACVEVELGDESRGALVNFDSKKVDRILKPSPMKKLGAGEPVLPMAPPPLTMAQVEEVKNIVKACPGVQELLGRGAAISTVGPHSTGVITISDNRNGEIRTVSFPIASQDKFEVTIELGKEHWAALVNLAEKKVEYMTETEWPRDFTCVMSIFGQVGNESGASPAMADDEPKGQVDGKNATPASNPNTESVCLLAVMPNTPIYTPSDLIRGTKVGLCLGSDLEMLKAALDTYDIPYSPIFLPPGELLLALQSGVIDVALVTEHPWDILVAEDFQTELRFLPWSNEAIEAMTQQFPQAVAAELPANTYPWQSESVPGYSS
jgi:predicted nucleic acid-binding Zn finger protein